MFVAALVLIAALYLVFAAGNGVTSLRLTEAPSSVVRGDFFKLGLTVEVYYGSSSETMFIDRGMFDERSLELLETEGRHEIILSFGGKQTSFFITVLSDEEFEENGLRFKYISGGGVALTSYIESFSEKIDDFRLIIPAFVRGEPVLKIGSYALSGSLFGFVLIPETLCEICDYAFSNCRNIEYFFVPKNVKKLGKSVFWGEKPFLRVLEVENADIEFDETSLNGCSISELTVFIEKGAFYDFLSGNGKQVKLNVHPTIEAQAVRKQNEYRVITDSGEQREIRFGDEDIAVSNSYKLYWAVALGLNPVAEVDSPAEALLSAIKNAVCECTSSSMSDKEKLTAIYEYICREASKNTEVNSKTEINHCAFLPEGVFLAHSAVCDGYAKAFVLCCRAVGIRAERAVGYYEIGSTLVYHAWNRVLLNGKWYEIDCTKGDVYRGLLSGYSEATVHYYLLYGLNDRENTATDGFNVELCDGMDFYEENGLKVNGIDGLESFIREHSFELKDGKVLEVYLKADLSAELSLIGELERIYRTCGISGVPNVIMLINHPDGGEIYLIGVL